MSFPALPLPSPPSLPKAQTGTACRQGPRAPLDTTGSCRAGWGRGPLTPGAAPKYKRCRCDATGLLDSAGLFPWGTGPNLLAVPPLTTAALGWGTAWGSVRKVFFRVNLRNGRGTGGQYSKKKYFGCNAPAKPVHSQGSPCRAPLVILRSCVRAPQWQLVSVINV